MSQREHEPHGDRPLAFLHQLASHIVDGGNMVGIDRMTKTKTVGQKRGAQQQRKMPEGQDSPEPRSAIEHCQHAVYPQHPAA